MISQIGRRIAVLMLGVSLVAALLAAAALAPAYAKHPGHAHAKPAKPAKYAKQTKPAAKPSTPVRLPKHPDGLTAPVTLPAGAEPSSAYFPQISCSPRDLPGVIALRDLLVATYRDGYGGISRSCTYGGTSEHKEGRALDWMLTGTKKRQRAVAGDFLAWLTADDGLAARRLGIMYVIYNHKIWSIYRLSQGWRPYSGSDGHTDHIHVSFDWAGARGATSFWTGKVGAVDYGSCRIFLGEPGTVRTKPRPARCLRAVAPVKRSKRHTRYYGTTTAPKALATAQRKLGIDQSGTFDAATWSAVRKYQKANDLPRTGALDDAAWSSLKPGSVTMNKAARYTRRHAAKYGARHYASTTLKRHSAGKAVLLLQKALHMPRRQRNGLYGKQTKKAVKAAKAARGMRRTAKVRGSLWEQLIPSR